MKTFNKRSITSESEHKICSRLTWMFRLQESMVFKKKISWKSQENNYAYFFNTDFGLNIIFSSLSSTLIWNAKLVWKVAFSRCFLDKFRNPKILRPI